MKALQTSEIKEFTYLMKLFLSCKGILKNDTKFDTLRDGIFEFKIWGHRFLSFILPDSKPKTFVITHAFIKKTNGPTPNKEIDKAIRIKNTVIEALVNNKLERI